MNTNQDFERIKNKIEPPAHMDEKASGMSVEALKANNLKKLGQLLYASHNSLRDDYEVTGIELDTLVEVASKQEGCIGARMTGAGFGGCAIALVHKNCTQDFMKNVQSEYTKKIGYEGGFFECSSGDGVNEIF